jgi:hypothetical protein
MRCPTCAKQGDISENLSAFCSQSCFKAVWKEHKQLHTKTGAGKTVKTHCPSLNVTYDASHIFHEVWPSFMKARKLGIDVSNTGFKTVGKLQGAEAELLIKTAECFLDHTKDDCNATPDETPIFSLLSPQHRIVLISEVVNMSLHHTHIYTQDNV